MISCKKLRAARRIPAPFLWRWHRQHGWRMAHTSTRRMQLNTHRWYCVLKRRQRAILLEWARHERDGYAACLEHRNRLPSNNDLPRSFVFWHMANVYARVGMGEDAELVVKDEEAVLLAHIRAYNAAQERLWAAHTKATWTSGCQGYYSEDEARTKMRHARTMMATV